MKRCSICYEWFRGDGRKTNEMCSHCEDLLNQNSEQAVEAYKDEQIEEIEDYIYKCQMLQETFSFNKLLNIIDPIKYPLEEKGKENR